MKKEFMRFLKLLLFFSLLTFCISCSNKNCTVCEGNGENSCIVCIKGKLDDEPCVFCDGDGLVLCTFCR